VIPEALAAWYDHTRAYLRLGLAEHKKELFGCFFLDNRHRVIEMAELFHGTIDGALVHPRVVVQRALEANAAAIVFFHNHPSGVAAPSHADEAITRRLKDARTPAQASVSRPFWSTKLSSLSDGPLGVFWPCSHFCTVEGLVLR